MACTHVKFPASTVSLSLFLICRWKGGWSTKLEGSDHAPVYVCLEGIVDVPQHDTPSISARYFPTIRGIQQTIGNGTLLIQKSYFGMKVQGFNSQLASFFSLEIYVH